MVRETSVRAYERLVESGKDQTQKAKILKHMIAIYPKTQTRLELGSVLGIAINAITGRVNDLVAAECLIEDGQRYCTVSGSMVYQLKAVIEAQQELF